MRVIVLGSGGSSGTPAVDWGWGRCDPANPRNRRTRPSILVQAGGTGLLIDTAPDLREQLLRAEVSRLDAVLYTHAHADHLHGIDDLRAINRAIEAPLPCYGDERTLATARQRFAYAFEPLPPNARGFYRPALVPVPLADRDTVRVGAIEVTVFEQDHGFSTTLGVLLREGGALMAYTTDLIALPGHAWEILAGLDLWIIGAFVDHPHPTHCDVDTALRWIERARPKRAVLSHLNGTLDYACLAARLPVGVEPAYDGMTIEIGEPGAGVGTAELPGRQT